MSILLSWHFPFMYLLKIRENLLSWLNRCLRENRKTKAMKRIHERSSQREVEKMWRFCWRRWASNSRQWTTGSCRGWWLQFPREWGGDGTRGGDGSKWIRTAEVHNHSEKVMTLLAVVRFACWGWSLIRPQQQRSGIGEKIEGVADPDTQFQQGHDLFSFFLCRWICGCWVRVCDEINELMFALICML